MMPLDDTLRACLAQIGEALDTPLLAVDHEGTAHVANRAARELMALGPGAVKLEPGGGPWQREVLDLLRRVPGESAAAEVYSEGGVRLVLEGFALSRDEAPWGAVVVVRSQLVQHPPERRPQEEVAEFAHQVKNSLHALLLNLYIVRRWAATQAFPEPQILTRLEALSTEMHRLNALAETFLPAGTGLQPGGEPVRLARVLDDVVAALADSAARAGVRVSVRVSPQLPAIRGDAHLLREALIALLRERLTQLARGDETEIVAGAGEEYAFLMVREARARPGEPRPAASPAGRALGVADWVVRRHGGTIETFEGAGAGATLLIKLPVTAGPPEARGAEPHDVTPSPLPDR
jgi:signal transduction histidine kinase